MDGNETPGPQTWSFTTGTSASDVLKFSLSPSDGSTSVSITSNMVATFNREIILNNPGKVTLRQQGSNSTIPATITATWYEANN
ncbi:hypothetical protein RE628_26670 [Paenibacillus sp. D2_2]|uniref:hypothetical protein n=1 Tax=Paenibacillus sp. D2_2 TaxID=3073092 RepID=UPI0028165F39|nr:hypothetical protein [Paenibacillus sp. D2_2]WMT40680.1 hypothetical protein RE628_26670 [Paenibacillus sp. D2_2]